MDDWRERAWVRGAVQVALAVLVFVALELLTGGGALATAVVQGATFGVVFALVWELLDRYVLDDA